MQAMMTMRRSRRSNTKPNATAKAALLFILWEAIAIIGTAAALSVTPNHRHKKIQHGSSGKVRPYVGSAINKNLGGGEVEFIVVGTSHYRCQSAQEVKEVITEEQPDGVLVELDPERLVRLTKEYAMTTPDQDFGADFLSAIQVAQDMDIPLFLGDEYTQATKERFVSTLFTPSTYNPKRLLASLFPTATATTSHQQEPQRIDAVQTFLQDPRKLVPLATSLAFPFLVTIPIVCLGQGFHQDPMPEGSNDVIDLINNLQVTLSLIFSALVSAKVYNTLIADRDDILASRSLQAAKVLQSLKRKESIRKTWRFTVEGGTQNETNSSSNLQQEMIPLFTLKTPLEAQTIRNLNLFEPRWLAMIDSIRDQKDPRFGCINCINKFYSVVQGPDGQEGRYADIIFKRQGRMAQLVQLTEGNRPSGARKVNTRIQGESKQFTITGDGKDVQVSPEGYLMAAKDKLISSSSSSFSSAVVLEEKEKEKEAEMMEPTVQDDDDEINKPVKVVVVVGLLHANGVLDLLSR